MNTKLLISLLKSIREDCTNALQVDWKIGDEVFKATIENINYVLEGK